MITEKTAPRRRRVATVLGMSLVFLLVQPALAGDGGAYEYPAPGYFSSGLSEQSSWDQILGTPGVKAEIPLVNFGPTFVPLSSVCVDGDMLAIADPRIDTGVRVSAAQLRDQVRAAMPEGGYLAAGGPQLAEAAPTAFPPHVALAYPVDVYKLTERGFFREFVFLFRKPWPVLNCPVK